MKDMVTPWPLVARDRELASFAAAWASRHCHGVVVCGPAGIGKTRLAEECLARAVRAGFTGGRATASAAAATVPLGAIAHLIPRGLDLSDPVAGFAAVARALSEPSGGRKRVLLVATTGKARRTAYLRSTVPVPPLLRRGLHRFSVRGWH